VRIYIALSLILFLCSSFPPVALAKNSCQEKKAQFSTSLVLNPEIAPPYILHDKSLQEINAETEATKKEWLQKNGMQEVWSSNELQTLGYAMGGLAAVTKIKMLSTPYDRYGTYYCPLFKDIEIDIIYRTLIRIPKEIPKGSCVYNHILQHEMRHHRANGDSFARYMTQLRKDLPRMASYFENTLVKRAAVQQKFQSMKSAIDDAVQLYIRDYVLVEAKKINEGIDSPQSYAAEAKKMEACH